MLAEDATDAMAKIKQALNFAQNLTGREKAVRDGIVSVLEAVDDEHVPLKLFMEMVRQQASDV